MDFYLNLENNSFVRGAGLNVAVGTASFKARDTLQIFVTFLRNGVTCDLAAEAQLVFCLKTGVEAAATTLALADTWTAGGEASGKYKAELDLNTANLIAALGDDDALSAVGEITWSEDAGETWQSSSTLAVRVVNDVYKGNEGTPAAAPTPDAQWVAHGHAQTLTEEQKQRAQENIGVWVKNNMEAAVAPTATDDSTAGYARNSKWFDAVGQEIYFCMDATEGAAVWIKATLTPDELGSAALLDSSEGGNYTDDSGKLAKYDANGILKTGYSLIFLYDGSTGTLSIPVGVEPIANIWAFPDKSGIVAMTSDIPSYTDPFNLVVEGDSIAKSLITSLSGKSYFSGKSTIYDVATAGQDINAVISSYATEVYPKRPAANGGKRAVLLVLAGTNDSTVDATIATNVSALLGYIATAKADGFEVWVCTLLARGPAGGINYWDGFNRRLKSSNVPDKIIDINSLFRDSADTDLFYDNLHPTAKAIDIITAEINKRAFEPDSFAPSNLGTMAKQNHDSVSFKGGGGTLSEQVIFSKASVFGNAKVNGGNDVAWAAESWGAGTTIYVGSFGTEGRYGIKTYQGTALVDALVWVAGTSLRCAFAGVPVAGAQVAIHSTTGGLLPPRMTTAQKTAISTKTAGTILYDTDLNKLCFWNGSAWETVTSA